jgi:hypothetical protein
MVQTGQMTREAAQSAKGKNVIMRAMGLKGSVLPDLQSVERRANDLYLFCSDGLTDLVEDWIIRDVLEAEGDDLYTAARALVKLANDYGGRDNCTVLLLRVGSAGSPERARPEPVEPFDVDTDKIAVAGKPAPAPKAAPAARRASAPNTDAPRRALAHDEVDAELLSQARARRGSSANPAFRTSDRDAQGFQDQAREAFAAATAKTAAPGRQGAPKPRDTEEIPAAADADEGPRKP